jgi:hypothetical protein
MEAYYVRSAAKTGMGLIVKNGSGSGRLRKCVIAKTWSALPIAPPWRASFKTADRVVFRLGRCDDASGQRGVSKSNRIEFGLDRRPLTIVSRDSFAEFAIASIRILT